MPYYHKNEWLALKPLLGYAVRFDIKNLFVVGAHRFDEEDVVRNLFPNLEEIHLFEPNPNINYKMARIFNGIFIHRTAIGSATGETLLHISNNDGASSSLHKFGDIQKVYPEIKTVSTVYVPIITWKDCFSHLHLPFPDALFVDTEGSEVEILKTYPEEAWEKLKVVFVEASQESMYEDVEASAPTIHQLLCSKDFICLFFMRIEEKAPDIINMLWLNRREFSIGKDC